MKQVSLLLLLFVSSQGDGHDYWIRPIDFFPKVGEEVRAHLLIGDEFVSELERLYQPEVTLRYDLVSARGRVDLRKEVKKDQRPIFIRKMKQEGIYLLAMERSFHQITLEAKKFNKYLKHEGLQNILKKRQKAGEADKAGRERYSRHLKSLFQVGKTADTTWQKRLGHRLEIIPLKNPLAMKKGDTLPIQVLLAGKPLPQTAIFAFRKEKSKVSEQSLRTDREGRATVQITGSGAWLIRLVYMRRCENPKLADWESNWSALTFGVR